MTDGAGAPTPDSGGAPARGGQTAEGGAAGAIEQLDPIAGAGGDNGGGPSVIGLHLEPAELQLDVELGQAEGATFDAIADYGDDSSTAALGGTWSSSDPTVASVDEQGRVTASAAFGGEVTIRYVNGAYEATAVVHVRLSATVFEGTLTPADASKLDDGALTTNGPAWGYPEDRTVFPGRMLAPTFQWLPGTDTFFRLRFERGDDVAITVYTSKLDYQPSASVWQALGKDFGGNIDLGLEGKASLVAESPRHGAAQRRIFLADAQLSGAIYSFQTGLGLQRLDLQTSQTISLFTQDQRCRSCHSPSRDGSLVSFQFDGGGPNPSGIYRTADGASLSPSGGGPVWGYSTFSPDTRALVASNEGSLKLYDTSDPGAPTLQTTLDLDGLVGTQPTWSPDGSTLAFIAREAAGSDWTFASSSLRLARWDREAEKFAKPSLLSSGEAVASSRDTLTSPTWSPDSRYLVVGIGSNSYVPTNMTLGLVDVVSQTRRELLSAAGGSINETPSFAPSAQGGYYWLVFTSNRAYGHTSSKRQLWVTAIDTQTGAEDPSHPAFWLPGQASEQDSFLGQWAPSACVGRGVTCAETAGCCAGLTCTSQENGQPTCEAQNCSTLGQPCVVASDCCAGAELDCRADLLGTLVCQP